MAENKNLKELADVLRELADMWPRYIECVMVAGAKYESIISYLEDTGVQYSKFKKK
jgi:hypothetical protein